MKLTSILKRLVMGIFFIPLVTGSIVIVAPISWVLTGNFDKYIEKVFNYYENL